MNRYGNKVGCHTPNMSSKIYNRINQATSVDWIDNSWHNDACDSMEHHIVEGEKWIKVMLPNSVVFDESQEEWNTFSVTDENQEELLDTTDIYEVIDFINEMFPHEDYPKLLPHQKLP